MQNKIIEPARYIPVSDLTPLPGNPRLIKDKRFEILKASIEKNPDFFEDRPCLINDAGGKLVIYAGNLRYKAALALGLKSVPCKVRTLTKEVQDELTVRDNVELGEFDWNILANEWDTERLIDWGMDLKIVADEDFTEEDIAENIDRRVVVKIECEVQNISKGVIENLKKINNDVYGKISFKPKNIGKT